ncbi:PAS domain-containing protein [Dongia sp.]|uniref:PAS domain-containing protein n=1 Tax=Dongia sp. TaxID=1977262 RepID=UPI0035B04A26
MSAWQDIDKTSSERVRALDAWWREKAADRRLPDRTDLDPTEIPQLLPYILLSEVVPPFRVRYRLLGTEVVAVTGMDFTGCYLDELIPPGDDEEAWMENYHLCAESMRPVYGLSTVRTLNGGTFSYEFGIWPLTKGTNAVSQFIGIEDYGPHRTRVRALLDQIKQWRRAKHE